MTNTVHEGVDATIARRNRYLTANYPRVGITVVEGAGCEFVDSNGRRYLDLFSGFGGTILGHCHPATTAAQSPKLPIPENRKYPPASNRLKVITSQKK